VTRSFRSSPGSLPKALLISLAVAVCAIAAGCGDSSSSAQRSRTTADADRHCDGSKIAAKRTDQRRRLDADLVGLRHAAATVKGHTENGNAKLDAALDRFSLDVAKRSLSVHERSDYINHAAAIVAPRCYICFQTLESNRPSGPVAKLPCG